MGWRQAFEDGHGPRYVPLVFFDFNIFTDSDYLSTIVASRSVELDGGVRTPPSSIVHARTAMRSVSTARSPGVDHHPPPASETARLGRGREYRKDTPLGGAEGIDCCDRAQVRLTAASEGVSDAPSLPSGAILSSPSYALMFCCRLQHSNALGRIEFDLANAGELWMRRVPPVSFPVLSLHSTHPLMLRNV